MFAVKSGFIGYNDHVVFLTRRGDLSPEQQARINVSEKKPLGEGGVVIAKDKVAAIGVAENAQHGLSITATGLMDDDIHALCPSASRQDEILTAIRHWVGRPDTLTESSPGLFARCGVQIVGAIGAAVITALLYLLVTDLDAENHDITGGKAAQKKVLYELAMTLGPVGTLVAGGVVTLALLWLAVKKSRQSYAIRTYRFA